MAVNSLVPTPTPNTKDRAIRAIRRSYDTAYHNWEESDLHDWLVVGFARLIHRSPAQARTDTLFCIRRSTDSPQSQSRPERSSSRRSRVHGAQPTATLAPRPRPPRTPLPVPLPTHAGLHQPPLSTRGMTASCASTSSRTTLSPPRARPRNSASSQSRSSMRPLA